ncbi:MAG: hypothetical protein HKP41_12850, partial [Desulfobacterales bacterium]|nr:hypothetical protein [Desulfobacterales bacterium]
MIDQQPGNNGEQPSRQQRIDSSLQPFTLVKYFSFSALGVFLIVTLFLSWII